ncbi:MAG TPA: glycosyltransferase [Bryobacteraceae bacterium]|nr:glycosyltransferase [Bryobacteraceae bacterium]
MDHDPDNRLIIVIPVFNDWHAVALLLPALDHALGDCRMRVEVLLVNDGSTQAFEPALLPQHFEHLNAVNILHLRRNLGHQRAIAVGLVHIHQHLACEAVVVMDGDGEDRPRDVMRLIDEFGRNGANTIIFAARAKRMEKLAFQLCYRIYCAAHWLLTGVRVRVGNFSIVPWQAVERLVVVSELWNHYAAAVFRARLPYRTVPIDRGNRINGESKMNFVALLVHGLSAISVFSDIVSTRLLVFASVSLAAMAGVAAILAGMRFIAHVGMPNWAGYAAAVLIILLAQALSGAFLLVFSIISARANMTFIPLRDAHHFIDRQERVFALDTLSIRRLRAGNL